MEDHEERPAGDPALPVVEHEDDTEDGIVPTVQVGQQQMVPVSELIRTRKEAKAARKELAELRPKVERAEQIGAQLTEIAPLIEQLRGMTPEQRQALATGKLPSPVATPQNTDDGEARQWAEENGLISADGGLDIARARRQLDYLDRRAAQQAQAMIAPVRQTAAQQAVANLKHQAYGITDNAGVPMATRESIDEAYAMLPAELASQPQVAHVVIGTAMLIDKMKGRAPKSPTVQTYGDPVFMEGGGARRNAPLVSPEEVARAKKIGLGEKDLSAAASALTAGGRGIRME